MPNLILQKFLQELLQKNFNIDSYKNCSCDIFRNSSRDFRGHSSRDCKIFFSNSFPRNLSGIRLGFRKGFSQILLLGSPHKIFLEVYRRILVFLKGRSKEFLQRFLPELTQGVFKKFFINEMNFFLRFFLRFLQGWFKEFLQ